MNNLPQSRDSETQVTVVAGAVVEGTVHRNALQPGYRLLWYHIEKILGQGGFGITYLAHDQNLDQPVAIKEYLPVELSVREGDSSVAPVSGKHEKQFKWGLERFIVEARTLAKFNHPNIVGVLSVFEENNTAYMVMNYEAGESLHAMLDSRKDISEDELKAIVLPILKGLHKVHEAGFVHRDIKPDNIIVRTDKTPVLIDFGSARRALSGATRTLTSVVSPGYAPFEQYYAKSDQQGPWTDIYSMGATLYRAVAGVAPMDAISRGEGILKASKDTLVSAVEVGADRYSKAFLQAIDYAIQFRETDRPSDVHKWAKALKATRPRQEPGSAKLSALDTDTATQIVDAARGMPAFKVERPAPVTRAHGATRSGRPWSIAGFGVVLIAAALGASHYQGEIIDWVAANTTLLPNPEPVATVSTQGTPPLVKAEPGESAAEIKAAAEQARLARERTDQIRGLLARARQSIAAQRLTAPPGDNAWAHLQAVLKIDPNHVGARKGILRLAGLVVEQASAAAAAGELDTAEAHLANALQIDPEATGVARVRAEMAAAREREAITTSIGDMLAHAQASLDAGRLLGPAGDNALDQFRKVLAVDENNAVAVQGIAAVAVTLVGQAEEAHGARNDESAEALLVKAEDIAPGLESIDRLRDKIAARQTRVAAAQQARRNKQQEAQELLAAAEADYQAGRLIDPPGDNAVERYLRHMELQPGNGRAKQGRVDLANRLKEWATSASLEGDFDLAYLYLDKAELLMDKPENINIIRRERRLVDERKLARHLAQERAEQLERELEQRLQNSGGQ